MKKAVRRERKAFRATCKTHGYYNAAGEGEGVAARLRELEGLCESLTLEQLQALNERMGRGSKEEGRSAVEEAVRIAS